MSLARAHAAATNHMAQCICHGTKHPGPSLVKAFHPGRKALTICKDSLRCTMTCPPSSKLNCSSMVVIFCLAISVFLGSKALQQSKPIQPADYSLRNSVCANLILLFTIQFSPSYLHLWTHPWLPFILQSTPSSSLPLCTTLVICPLILVLVVHPSVPFLIWSMSRKTAFLCFF